MRRHVFYALGVALCVALCGCASSTGAKARLADVAVDSCWQIADYPLPYDYADTYLMLKDSHYAICRNFVGHKRENKIGTFEYFSGDYSISGNVLTLLYPAEVDVTDSFRSKIVNLLFGGAESATFTYDTEYADFYYSTCLRGESLVMRNLTNPCKVGGVYELDGMEVVKTEPVPLTVAESVPLYSEPRFGSAPYHYRYNLETVLRRKGAKPGKAASSSFLPGLMTYSDARSTRKYTDAGGNTGTWYHVHLSSSLVVEATEADNIEWCWIFTDGIVPIEDGADVSPYNALLEEYATATGAVTW